MKKRDSLTMKAFKALKRGGKKAMRDVLRIHGGGNISISNVKWQCCKGDW